MMSERVESTGASLARELEFVSNSEVETQELGAALAHHLGPGDVVAMYGELGAGKTNFVKGLARGLGIRAPVHSPTFILANEYRGGRLPLYHVDAYRISSAEEAIGIGVEDYLDGEGVTVVEWAERIGSALPNQNLRVEFQVWDETRREIRVQGYGKRYLGIVEELGIAVASEQVG